MITVEKFTHPSFIRGQEETLHEIARKAKKTTSTTPPKNNSRRVKKEVSSDVVVMEQDVEASFDNAFVNMRLETLEASHREMTEQIAVLQYQNNALAVQLSQQNELIKSLVATLPGVDPEQLKALPTIPTSQMAQLVIK